MTCDRKVYFDTVRESLFGGSMTQRQVDGQNAILDGWELPEGGEPDYRWLAYMLATTFHETAQKMWPIEEYGKGQGHPYGQQDPQTKQTYYGRGFVQLTWRNNYHYATEKLFLEGDDDLEWHAERALDVEIATDVLIQGMMQGWFTGKKCADYFNAETEDSVNARQIVNGNDCDELIAGYYDKFAYALVASEVVEDVVTIAIQAPDKVRVTVTVNGETV